MSEASNKAFFNQQIPTSTKYARTMTSASLNLLPQQVGAEEAGIHLARSATKRAIELHNKFDDMAATIKSDPMINPQAAKVKAATAIQELAQEVRKSFDQADSQLLDEMERVDFRMRASERLSTEHNQAASEVRAHFKTLNDREQQKLIQQATNEGDKLTLQALVNAPPYLSGMTLPAIRKAASGLHDPDDSASMERLQATRELLPNNLRAFEKKVSQYWDGEVERLIAAAAAAKL